MGRDSRDDEEKHEGAGLRLVCSMLLHNGRWDYEITAAGAQSIHQHISLFFLFFVLFFLSFSSFSSLLIIAFICHFFASSCNRGNILDHIAVLLVL